MKLCSSGHGEVCYEDRHCPACALRESMQDDIDGLHDELKESRSELKDVIAELEGEIRDLNAQLVAAERDG